MNGDQLAPFGELELVDGRHGLDAGIGDHDVDLAEGGDRLGDAGIDLRLVGDVDADADRALLAAKLGGGGVGAFLIEVGDHHLRALAREERGDFLADAAGRTGDDGNLVLKTHGSSPRDGRSAQIVVDDLAEAEGQIGDDVRGG